MVESSMNVKVSGLEDEVRELREAVRALTRRGEDLEATTFQLLDDEEVLLITVPKRSDARCVQQTS